MRNVTPLFVHPKNDYTGSTRVLADIIQKEYYDRKVTIVALNNNYGFLSELSNVTIISCWLPLIKGKSIKIFSEFIYSLQLFFIIPILGFKHPIIYINTIIPFAAALSARIMRKKVIYHIHEVLTEEKVLNRIRKYVFTHTKCHRIFVSKYTKMSYIDNNNCTSEIKHNRLSESFLNKVHKCDVDKRKLNTILMISSLSVEKGVFNFIDLAALLPEYKFILILSTDLNTIKENISCSISDNLDIYPAQSDIHPFLARVDLMVNMTNPSLCVETFGMTILEAMPYGIPSIVPNIGGPIELVQNDYNGYTVDTSDVYSVKSGIIKALEKENYKRLSENTLKVFEAKFRYLI